MNKTKITVDQLQGSGIDTESAKEAQSSKRIEIINSLKSDFEESASRDGDESGSYAWKTDPVPDFYDDYQDWLESTLEAYPEITEYELNEAGMTPEYYNCTAQCSWDTVMSERLETEDWGNNENKEEED